MTLNRRQQKKAELALDSKKTRLYFVSKVFFSLFFFLQSFLVWCFCFFCCCEKEIGSPIWSFFLHRPKCHSSISQLPFSLSTTDVPTSHLCLFFISYRITFLYRNASEIEFKVFPHLKGELDIWTFDTWSLENWTPDIWSFDNWSLNNWTIVKRFVVCLSN